MTDIVDRLRAFVALDGGDIADIETAADALDAQAKEIEALKADRDSWEKQASDRVDDCLTFITERNALRDEVAGLRKDAARYRWLRDTSNPDNPAHMIALHINEKQPDASLSGIDAAIDAAMAAQEKT